MREDVGWQAGIIPVGVAVATLTALLAYVVHRGATFAEGHFAYALDDAYIHMAIARNLALHGVWGVTPYGFSSSTSSPLWTLLLSAVYLVAGPGEWAPLYLNLAFALLLLAVAACIGRRCHLPTWLSAVTLVAVVLLTPLVPLIVGGMEHLLQIAAALAFVWLSGEAIARAPARARRLDLLLLAAGVTLSATRYEGMALVAVASLLLALRRRPALAALLIAASSAPLVAVAGYSAAHGWPVLPVSILLKAPAVQPHAYAELTRLVVVASGQSHVSGLVAVALVFLLLRYRRHGLTGDPVQVALVVFAAGVLVHMIFGGFGWLYRYEAYLVCVGLVFDAVAAAAAAREGLLGRASIAAALAIALVPGVALARRATESADVTARMMGGIYSQPLQVGRFLGAYYHGARIAVGDIGAVSWYAEPRLLDIWGLGSLEVARLKLDRHFDREHLAKLVSSHGADVAVVFDAWLPGGAPETWQKVGEWTVAQCPMCGSRTVSFYAVRPDATDPLRSALATHARRLPASVTSRIVRAPAPAAASSSSAPPPGARREE